MKAKKIWIAQHPHNDKLDEVEFSFTDKSGEGVYIDTCNPDVRDEYVMYKEYIIIEVES